jgi:hypothetical protein
MFQQKIAWVFWMRSITGKMVSTTNREAQEKNKKNSLCKKIVCYLFESFSVSFSDLDNAMETYAQMDSDETKSALENSLNDDVIMNYYISTQWSFIIDEDSMASMTPEQLIDQMTLSLDDPNFVVTLDMSDPSSPLLIVAKKYEDGDNLDEIHDLVENIISTDIGIVVESDLNYGFVVDGNIATVSSAASSAVSESLGIDFELQDDSVIFCVVFFSFFFQSHKVRYYMILKLIYM